jgi:3'-5' exoribonuclease
MIDNLGGRLGSFDRLEKELPDGRRWSPYDRALGGGAYFAARPEGDAGAGGEACAARSRTAAVTRKAA